MQSEVRNITNCRFTFKLEEEKLVIEADCLETSFFSINKDYHNGASEQEMPESKDNNDQNEEKDLMIKIGTRKEMSQYKSYFSYASLPITCKVLFNNIYEIYCLLIDEEACQIIKEREEIEVSFKLYHEDKYGVMQRKIQKFVLPITKINQSLAVKSEEQLEASDADSLWKDSLDQEKIQEHKQEYRKLAYDEIIQRQILKLQSDLQISIKGSEKAQQQADSLKVYIEDFVDKMHEKWSKMLQQYSALKKKEKENTIRIEALQRNSTPNKNELFERYREVKCVYKFSQRYRERSIKVFSPQIAKCCSTDDSFKSILIEPTTFLTRKDPNITQFKVDIKIKCITKYIALGVCEKEVLKALNFKEYENDIKGHGCYLLDWNGQSWSNYRQNEKSQVIESLRFKEGDIIRMVFKSHRKLLTITKKGKSESTCIMIDPSIPLNQLCFCVFLGGNGDEVEINPAATINLEKEE